MLLLRNEMIKQENISNFFSGFFFFFCECQQILFLPIFEYFLWVFKCNSTDNGYIHASFNEVRCFEGNHIVHMFIALINLVIFTLIVIYNERFIVDYRKRTSSKSK